MKKYLASVAAAAFLISAVPSVQAQVFPSELVIAIEQAAATGNVQAILAIIAANPQFALQLVAAAARVVPEAQLAAVVAAGVAANPAAAAEIRAAAVEVAAERGFSPQTVAAITSETGVGAIDDVAVDAAASAG